MIVFLFINFCINKDIVIMLLIVLFCFTFPDILNSLACLLVRNNPSFRNQAALNILYLCHSYLNGQCNFPEKLGVLAQHQLRTVYYFTVFIVGELPTMNTVGIIYKNKVFCSDKVKKNSKVEQNNYNKGTICREIY